MSKNIPTKLNVPGNVMSCVVFQKGYFGVCNFSCLGCDLIFLNYWNARKVSFSV